MPEPRDVDIAGSFTHLRVIRDWSLSRRRPVFQLRAEVLVRTHRGIAATTSMAAIGTDRFRPETSGLLGAQGRVDPIACAMTTVLVLFSFRFTIS